MQNSFSFGHLLWPVLMKQRRGLLVVSAKLSLEISHCLYTLADFSSVKVLTSVGWMKVGGVDFFFNQ